MDHQVSAGPPHALLAVATLALLAAGSFHGVAPAGVLVVVLHGTYLVGLLLAGSRRTAPMLSGPLLTEAHIQVAGSEALVVVGDCRDRSFVHLYCSQAAWPVHASSITLLAAGVSTALQARQHLPDYNHSTTPLAIQALNH